MAAIKTLAESGGTPQQGKWYRLLSDFGEGVGMLTKQHRYKDQDADRMLRVLAIVEPATSGVGYSAEDTVLCLWLEAAVPGRLSLHHISFPKSQFVELVGSGTEPPEYADWQAQQGGE